MTAESLMSTKLHVIEKTKNQKENTESSKTVSADLYKGSTRNPSDVIFAIEWNTHVGKNCFARAIQVLRTTTGKYVSKTFQANKIKRFQQNKRTFVPFLLKMQSKNPSLSVKPNSFFLDIGKARLRHCRK